MIDDYDLYCRRCTHVKFDLEKGILCGLTNSKPKLHKGCSLFEIDEIKDRQLTELDKIRSKRQKQVAAYNDGYFSNAFSLSRFAIAGIAYLFALLLIYIGVPEEYVRYFTIGIFVLIPIMFLIFSLKSLAYNERLIIYRKEQLDNIVGPGFAIVIPFYHKSVRVFLNDSIPNWKEFSEGEIRRRIRELYINT
jgi:hypothetical protein